MHDLVTGVAEVLAEWEGGRPSLELSRIPGGASRDTWLIEADDGRRWVLRRDPEGSVSLVAMREEFGLLQLARDAGVPVPEPLAFEPAGGRFGSSGVLMGFVEGTSVAPRVLRKPEYESARGILTAQLAEALARIHSLGPSDVAASCPRLRPIQRSPRSKSGSASSMRSASRSRRSSSACAGCGRTHSHRPSRGSSTATSDSATSLSTRTGSRR